MESKNSKDVKPNDSVADMDSGNTNSTPPSVTENGEKSQPSPLEIIICTSLIVVGLILSLVNGYIPNTPNQKEILKTLEEIKTQTINIPFPELPENEMNDILKNHSITEADKQKSFLYDIKKLLKNESKDQTLKKLDQLNDLIINTEMTNIFFRHIVGLLAILSGMIGFFWISISKKREEREKLEGDERKKIREWELSRIALQNSQHLPIFDKIVNSKILINE